MDHTYSMKSWERNLTAMLAGAERDKAELLPEDYQLRVQDLRAVLEGYWRAVQRVQELEQAMTCALNTLPLAEAPYAHSALKRALIHTGVRALYQHAKGGMYMLLGTAVRRADHHPVTVYRALVDGSVWVRPSSEFHARFTAVPNEDSNVIQ